MKKKIYFIMYHLYHTDGNIENVFKLYEDFDKASDRYDGKYQTLKTLVCYNPSEYKGYYLKIGCFECNHSLKYYYKYYDDKEADVYEYFEDLYAMNDYEELKYKYVVN